MLRNLRGSTGGFALTVAKLAEEFCFRPELAENPGQTIDPIRRPLLHAYSMQPYYFVAILAQLARELTSRQFG